MASRTPSPQRGYWLPLLVAASLLVPIFISTVVHTELFLGFMLAGMAVAAAVALARGRAIAIEPRTAALGAILAGVLLLRGVFSANPMVTLYGAYGADNTLLTLATVIAALLAGTAWLSSSSRTGSADDSLTGLFAVIAGYAAASMYFAWQWGSTDGVGGPPSGLTSNSQYQVQLMLVGLGAALAWAAQRRRSWKHLVPAAGLAVSALVGIQQARSSAALVALAVGAVYVASLAFSAGRVPSRVFAGAWTALVALAGVAISTLLLTDSTGTWLARFDALGNGRGLLWSSALEVIRRVPLFGRGLSQAAATTRWNVTASTLDVTTTVDPHNLMLTLAIGGGVIAVAVAIVWLFVLQRALFDAVSQTPRGDRALPLALLSASVALFTFAQFAFVYPVAWALAALLAGIALTRARTIDVLTENPSPAPRFAVGASAALALALVAGMSASIPARSASLMLSAKGFQSPLSLLEGQLALARHPWDCPPAETAVAVFTDGARSKPELVDPLRPRLEQVRATVRPNGIWDARLDVQELQLWMSDLDRGQADPAELERLLTAGMAADPGSGLWATAGTALFNRAGDSRRASTYARMVNANRSWLLQAQSSADATTVALIERLGR